MTHPLRSLLAATLFTALTTPVTLAEQAAPATASETAAPAAARDPEGAGEDRGTGGRRDRQIP